MRALRQSVFLVLLASSFASLALPALADSWRYRGYNIRTFNHYDYKAWRHGYWYHGWRGGRYAWWWYGGGIWYPYAAPIYPYPNPYVPPTIVVQQAPVQSLPAPAQTWYCCPIRRVITPMFRSVALAGRRCRQRRSEGDKA